MKSFKSLFTRPYLFITLLVVLFNSCQKNFDFTPSFSINKDNIEFNYQVQYDTIKISLDFPSSVSVVRLKDGEKSNSNFKYSEWIQNEDKDKERFFVICQDEPPSINMLRFTANFGGELITKDVTLVTGLPSISLYYLKDNSIFCFNGINQVNSMILNGDGLGLNITNITCNETQSIIYFSTDDNKVYRLDLASRLHALSFTSDPTFPIKMIKVSSQVEKEFVAISSGDQKIKVYLDGNLNSEHTFVYSRGKLSAFDLSTVAPFSGYTILFTTIEQPDSLIDNYTIHSIPDHNSSFYDNTLFKTSGVKISNLTRNRSKIAFIKENDLYVAKTSDISNTQTVLDYNVSKIDYDSNGNLIYLKDGNLYYFLNGDFESKEIPGLTNEFSNISDVTW